VADSTINGLVSIAGGDVDTLNDEFALWDNSALGTKKLSGDGLVTAVSPKVTPKWSLIVDKPEYTVGDGGAAETIAEAITAIGASEKLLLVPYKAAGHAGPATVPTNVTIRFERGALLASGALTINGELEAGNYKILNGGTLVIGATCRNQHVNPMWWGAVGDNSTNNYAAFLAMGTSIGSVAMTVKPSPGTYKVQGPSNENHDLTFADNIAWELDKGVILAPGVVACTGTLAYTYTTGAGTLTCTTASRKLAGVSETSAGLKWVKSVAGNLVRIMPVGAGAGWYAYDYPTVAEGPVSYTISPILAVGAGGSVFTTELRVGDFLYVGGQTMICTWIVSDTSMRVHNYYNFEVAAGAFTRSLRINIAGDIKAGRYQIFSGNGTVRLPFNIEQVYPEWWGAKASGVTGDAATNSAAIDKCIFAGTKSPDLDGSYDGSIANMVNFSHGTYFISKAMPVVTGVVLRGAGMRHWVGGGTCIRPISSGFADPYLFMGISGGFRSTAYTEDFEITGYFLEAVGYTYGKSGIGGIYNYNGHNSRAYVHHNFVHNAHEAVRLEGGGENLVESNRAEAVRNGIINLFDGWTHHNDISHGGNLIAIASSTFTSAAGWTVGANWTINTGAGQAEHTAGSVEPLVYTFTAPAFIDQGVPFVVLITHRRTSGTDVITSVTAGGATAWASIYSNTEVFQAVEIPAGTGATVNSDPDRSQTLTITPGINWVGYIADVQVLTGIGLWCSSGSIVTNNTVFSDVGGVPQGAFSAYMSGGKLSQNRLGPAGCPVYIYMSASRGTVDNNELGFARGNCINIANTATNGRSYLTVKDNSISGYALYGIISGNIKGTEITGNSFVVPTGIAPFYITDNSGTYPGLIENNVGFDVGDITLPSLTANSATPSVMYGKNWKTANTIVTTITNFTKGAIGKSIVVKIDDAVTVIGFGGTSIKGNMDCFHYCSAGDTIMGTMDEDSVWRFTTSWHPLGPPAKCAAGTTAGKAKTQMDITYTIPGAPSVPYVKAATDDLFDCTAITTTTYAKLLFTLNSSGTATVTKGTEAASQAAALMPAIPGGGAPIGWAEVGPNYAGGALTVLHDFL
jgi:hypothetical protein